MLNSTQKEYSMPRSFYNTKVNFPKFTYGTCDSCIKYDVCNLKGDFARLQSDVTDIVGKSGLAVKSTLECEKWASNETVR